MSMSTPYTEDISMAPGDTPPPADSGGKSSAGKSWPQGEVWSDFVRHLTTANTLDQLTVVLELTTHVLFAWDAFFVSVRQPGRNVFLRIQAIDTIHGNKVRLGPKKETQDAYSPQLQPIFRQEGILINRSMESDPQLLTRFGDVTRPSMSLIYAPITGAKQVEGVLSVQSYSPHRYSINDLQTLMDLASLAAPTLSRILAEQEVQHQEQRFHRLLDLTSDAIVITDAETGEILEANKHAEETLGRSFAGVMNQCFFDFFSTEDKGRLKSFINELFSTEEGRLTGLALDRHDGQIVSLEATASLLEHYGRPVVMCRLRDSAGAFNADDQRMLLASFPELNPNPVVEAAQDGEILFQNAEAERLFPDLRSKGLKHPFMHNLMIEADRYRSRGKAYFLRDIEVKDQWFEQMIHLTQPNRLRIYAFDITPRKKTEAKLRFDALHDTLTKLPNRALFLDRLGKALKRVARDKGARLAVFFMDLDNFKIVNDTMGHHMGDELLKEFASRIQQCLRPGDTLSRLGGDEFTILLDPIASLDTACQVADRILETTKKPFLLNDQEFFVTTSIGISYLDTGERKAEDILQDADVAMYHAKRQGKNQYIVFEEGLHTIVTRRKLLASDVRRALHQEFFSLHFQPIVNLPDRRIAGWEALARWYHPERGAVPPEEFIELADESGIGGEFAQWTLNESCHQIHVWNLKFGRTFCLHLNVTSRQLRHPGLVESIDSVLKETSLAPINLILELPEKDFMNDAPVLAEIQARLSKLGVRFCLDNFGTSHSSLHNLALHPLDFIKVDRSFVQRMAADPVSRLVVESAGALGRVLRCGLIAEGVEDQSTMEMVSGVPCTFAQGYFFGAPMDAMEANRLLSLHHGNPS